MKENARLTFTHDCKREQKELQVHSPSSNTSPSSIILSSFYISQFVLRGSKWTSENDADHKSNQIKSSTATNCQNGDTHQP